MVPATPHGATKTFKKSCIKRFVNSVTQPYLQVYPYHNEYLEP